MGVGKQTAFGPSSGSDPASDGAAAASFTPLVTPAADSSSQTAATQKSPPPQPASEALVLVPAPAEAAGNSPTPSAPSTAPSFSSPATDGAAFSLSTSTGFAEGAISAPGSAAPGAGLQGASSTGVAGAGSPGTSGLGPSSGSSFSSAQGASFGASGGSEIKAETKTLTPEPAQAKPQPQKAETSAPAAAPSPSPAQALSTPNASREIQTPVPERQAPPTTPAPSAPPVEKAEQRKIEVREEPKQAPRPEVDRAPEKQPSRPPQAEVPQAEAPRIQARPAEATRVEQTKVQPSHPNSAEQQTTTRRESALPESQKQDAPRSAPQGQETQVTPGKSASLSQTPAAPQPQSEREQSLKGLAQGSRVSQELQGAGSKQSESPSISRSPSAGLKPEVPPRTEARIRELAEALKADPRRGDLPKTEPPRGKIDETLKGAEQRRASAIGAKNLPGKDPSAPEIARAQGEAPIQKRGLSPDKSAPEKAGAKPALGKQSAPTKAARESAEQVQTAKGIERHPGKQARAVGQEPGKTALSAEGKTAAQTKPSSQTTKIADGIKTISPRDQKNLTQRSSQPQSALQERQAKTPLGRAGAQQAPRAPKESSREAAREARPPLKSLERLINGEGISVEKVAREVVRIVKHLLRIPVRDEPETEVLPEQKIQALAPENNISAAQTTEPPLETQIQKELLPEDLKAKTEAVAVYTVRGRVVDYDTGSAMSGVLISSPQLGTTRTDLFGQYVFENAPLGISYVITPIFSGYEFMPKSASGIITGHAHHPFFGKAQLN